MTAAVGPREWAPPRETDFQQAGRWWDAVRLQLCRDDCTGAHVLDILGDASGAVLHDRIRRQLYWLVPVGSAAGWTPPGHVTVLTAPSWVLVAHANAERTGTVWLVPPLPDRYLTPAADLAVALGLVLGSAP